MARPKRYRLIIDFDSPEDLKSWSEGTEKRPYIIQEQDALHKMLEKKKALIRTFHIKAFADEDAPAEEDLHPIAQGIRLSRLG